MLLNLNAIQKTSHYRGNSTRQPTNASPSRWRPSSFVTIALLLTAWSAAVATVTVEPNTIAAGKITDVMLHLEAGDELADIRLQPGGPYPLFHIDLHTTTRDIVAAGDRLFVAEAHRLSVFSREGKRVHHVPSDNGFTRLAHIDDTLIALEGNATVVIIDIAETPTIVQRMTLDNAIDAIDASGDEVYILTEENTILKAVTKNIGDIKFIEILKIEDLSKIHLSGGRIHVLQGNSDVAIYQHQNQTTTEIGRYHSGNAILDFTIADGIAYLGTDSGVTLVDLADPQQPLWLGSHQQLGRVVQVAVSDGIVWARTDDHRLYTLNTANPAEPTVIAAYRSPAAISAAALTQNRAYALTESALTAIDFRSRNPLISNQTLDFGQGVNFGGQRRAYIDNQLAYVADWFSGIHIYDLHNPRLPALLTSFHTLGSPKGIVVRDGLAYVADDDHGLQVIDVSDPRNPRQVANLATRGLAYTPTLAGDRLYLASHHGGFQIIDISTPRAPRLLGEYDTPGKAWSLAIKDQVAYVADDDAGLLIFDVSDPRQPQLVSQFSPGGAAEEVILHGDIAYVAFFEGPVVSLDISDPRIPRPLGQITVPGNARGLDRVGNRLFVAGWLAGVHVLDISDPTQPAVLGSYDTPGATWGIYARDRYAYAMDWWGGLRVLDIADPTAIKDAGGYHQRGQVVGLAARGNYLFTAHDNHGVHVFDINNPLNPTWTTGVSFPGQALDIAITGDVAAIAAGDGGLALIDISDPYQIKWLASLDLPIDPQRLIVDQGYAYLLDRQAGIAIVDIRATANPRLISHIADRWSAIALTGDTLYLAEEEALVSYRATEGHVVQLARRPIAGPIRHLLALDDNLTIITDSELIQLRRMSYGLIEAARMALSFPVRDIASADTHIVLASDQQLISLNHNTLNPLNRYPLLNQGTRLLNHNGILYLAGKNTITAVQPLPTVAFAAIPDTGYQLTLPANLSLGDYHLYLTYRDATTTQVYNGLHVQQLKFSKPKLSWEAFQKILQEKKNTDLFN